MPILPPEVEPPSPSADSTQSRDDYTLTDQTNLLPFRQIVVVFMGLSMCMLVSNLESSVVATALPTISAVFNAGTVSAWVPAAYMLTSTCFLPLYGRLSDIFGRKATLCFAMGTFMIGSLAAGFAQNITQLIIFRGVSGAGGGGIVSIAQIVISDVVSLRERGKYQGIIGVVYTFGFAIGPIMGGALAEKVSWRWCFWIILPLSALSICLVVLVLPLKPVEGDMKKKLLAVDYVGAGLSLVACSLIILPLNWGGITFPWDSAIIICLFISGSFCILIFCLWEWKGAHLPMVPTQVYIFKQSTVVGVYIITTINGVIFYSSLFYLPQFFQIALGYTPIQAGAFLLPLLIMQAVASSVCGKIISYTGNYRNMINSGFALLSIGNGLLSTIEVRSPKGLLVFYMLLAGLGSGQTMNPTTVACQASVPRRDISVVTTLRNFLRLLGGTLSLAIGSTIVNNSLRDVMTSIVLPSSTIDAVLASPRLLSSPTKFSSLGISSETAAQILDGYRRGFRIVFILNAGLAAFATVVGFLLVQDEDLSKAEEKEEKDKQVETAEKHRPQQSDAEMGVVPSINTEQ